MTTLQSRGFVRAPQALVPIEGSARSQLIASFLKKVYHVLENTSKTRQMTTKLSKWAPARPIAAAHRNARYQRIIHRWLAHWIPSGRQTSNLSTIVKKSPLMTFLFLRFLHFCVFCESTRLWRPEYGDFYTIMANFEFWQPEGTQWANQRGMIRWYRALGRVPSDGPSDVNFNWFSGLRNKPKMG